MYRRTNTNEFKRDKPGCERSPRPVPQTRGAGVRREQSATMTPRRHRRPNVRRRSAVPPGSVQRPAIH